MTLKERTDALARVPAFAGLSRRALERVARIAKDVELRPGQVLIEARAKGSGVFVRRLVHLSPLVGAVAQGAPDEARPLGFERAERRASGFRLRRDAPRLEGVQDAAEREHEQALLPPAHPTRAEARMRPSRPL